MSASNNSDQPLRHTPLFDLHVELGGKMVPFTGYSLPVQYPTGIIKEHTHTREQAGLFDVSHMGQVRVKGNNASAALETLIPVDIGALAMFKQSYAVLTNEQGGILDDLIITRWAEDEFFLVVNAACKDQDVVHLKHHLPQLEIEVLEDRALLALQGPNAKTVMNKLAPLTAQLTFMTGCWTSIALSNNQTTECFVTRSGYTGEDGFEISVPAAKATEVARLLLSDNSVWPVGLGARDSLRLEAGLCLYGHDMDQNTSPVEASLLWSISKSRRTDGNKAGGFLGADAIFQQIQQGVRRKRVGFKIDGRAPVREGTEIVEQNGHRVGTITSGGFGPTLEEPVAMGYVESGYAKPGTSLLAVVRKKQLPITVTKMPFVNQRYIR